ncbi:MAG: Lrp/AsnC family transcriptional regulator [Alphaproteobacteria bacterium]|nr:MAG: Lrp/AsnC family transcriptional regulator [Alphaproteobacteria bacterium]
MKLDRIDRAILAALERQGRLSNVELAQRVGLSASACSRRVLALEAAHVIQGYRAVIDPAARGMGVNAIVEITLKGQGDAYLSAFEAAVAQCPNILSCDLMSGTADYVLRVGARDLGDFERLHREVLSRLPGVSRIESSFVLRRVAGQ